MAEGGEERLPDLFEKVWSSWEYLENTEDSSASYNVQKNAIIGLTSAEKAIRMVNELCLFSDNEELEEVATNEIKYLLLPAFMGCFTERKTVKKPSDRLDVVKKAKGHYVDFLRNCDSYGVAEINKKLLEFSPNSSDISHGINGPAGMESMIRSREEKIKAFKEKKELDARTSELHEKMKLEHVDDEVKRDYYTCLLKQWISNAIESLDSLQVEITMLTLRAQTLDEDVPKTEEPKKEVKKPFRPFIITKDMIQKTVFGAGYPSIPSMTIEEFYESKVKDGTFQAPGSRGHSMQDWAADPEKDKEDQEKEQEEKENKIEKDDEAELQKARQWDDWKDDHRRGWGNRKNMG